MPYNKPFSMSIHDKTYNFSKNIYMYSMCAQSSSRIHVEKSFWAYKLKWILKQNCMTINKMVKVVYFGTVFFFSILLSLLNRHYGSFHVDLTNHIRFLSLSTFQSYFVLALSNFKVLLLNFWCSVVATDRSIDEKFEIFKTFMHSIGDFFFPSGNSRML